jgi:farnesyl-diphosphate farnesyltransferase
VQAEPFISVQDDLLYQEKALEKVSRTFALTIPELPPGLREVVGNAYLLCRLADTIEDDAEMDSELKEHFMAAFLSVIAGTADPQKFADELAEKLSRRTPESEYDLVSNTKTVVRITAGFSAAQRQAVLRCVTTMCQGMPEFQNHKTLDGLPDLVDLERYCYFVAGIVGETLTDLFCDYSDEIAKHRSELMSLAVCFGQGLQMTNILKDIWEDSESNTCWLPRSLFTDINGGLRGAIIRRDPQAMADGIEQLVGIAHAHLSAALRYTMLIPKNEPGIRRFCLWAIGMAVLTLQKINNHPGYAAGKQVKISRRAVKTTVVVCNLGQYSNRALEILFRIATRGLPDAPTTGVCPPSGARLVSDRLS